MICFLVLWNFCLYIVSRTQQLNPGTHFKRQLSENQIEHWNNNAEPHHAHCIRFCHKIQSWQTLTELKTTSSTIQTCWLFTLAGKPLHIYEQQTTIMICIQYDRLCLKTETDHRMSCQCILSHHAWNDNWLFQQISQLLQYVSCINSWCTQCSQGPSVFTTHPAVRMVNSVVINSSQIPAGIILSSPHS